MTEETIKKINCPRCFSTEITAQKQGFSLGKSAAVGALTGGVCFLAGFVGSWKIKLHCLNCGNSWKPGK